MEIKARSVYDQQTLKDFITFSLHKGKFYKTRRIARLTVWPALAALSLVMMGVLALIGKLGDNLPMLATLTFLFLFFWIYMGFIMPRVLLRRNAGVVGTENTFVFADGSFTLESNNPSFTDNMKMEYSSLHKVYETQNYLYIYLNAMQAYIVDKRLVENGAVGEVIGTLRGRVDKGRYVACQDA